MSSFGRTATSMRVASPRSTAPFIFKMSPGRDMNTGPVGGVIATLAALWSTRGRSSSLDTSVAHFTCD